MRTANSGSHGIRWGVIIGIVYCILLLLRFSIGVSNIVTFALFTAISFIGALVLLFFCGASFRKKNEGYLEMRDAFKVMFIAVLLLELFYAVFSFVYLKFINPAFFETFQLNNKQFLKAAGQPQVDGEKISTMIDSWAQQARSVNVFDFLKSYLYNVAITGAFAFLFAFILKRKSKTLQSENFNQV